MSKKILFVEKKPSFNVEGEKLKNDFIENLNININDIRVINRYIIENVREEVLEKSKYIIFAEKPVDSLYEDEINLEGYNIFGVEYLKGQYDQRADAAEEAMKVLALGKRPNIHCSKFIAIKGDLKEKELDKIKKYYINPVDSKEAYLKTSIETENLNYSKTIEIIPNFYELNDTDFYELYNDLNLAMTYEDFKLCKDYFKLENRNPTITEIKVIDTYWSDHCRHTTFLTSIKNIEFEEGDFTEPIKNAFLQYKKSREYLNRENKDITLMDLATIIAKELKTRGILNNIDESEEINACTIKANIETNKGIEEYLILFKNETHNHPTEIEPFGGAATCLGGAIRDPLSGRAYVYQAMRVTGSGNPNSPLEKTLKGKLPQKVITKGSAKGYSSYGNEIGLATGQVKEFYDEGFIAKRMEVGAVVGAVPSSHVKREIPKEGDIVLLLGGRTGRDGCGGATGSSKKHSLNSIETCGAEVQKGNPITERKLQRFFRNPKVSKMIKRCNDFGAGGVSVAVGELAEGLDIYLDNVPKKYEGLDGTELAISESQERMAVVIDKNDFNEFINLASTENLEATKVADITSLNRVRMFWNNHMIVDLSRDFLNTNGAKSYINAVIKPPKKEENYFKKNNFNGDFKDSLEILLKDLNICSQKGLSENFDSTIGRGTILMPWGGKYQLTEPEGMAGKVPVYRGDSKDCTLMTFGYNPKISKFSPFHGALYAVVESVCKIVALGGDYSKVYLTFQEYFEKLEKDEEKWGKPLSALLGALYVQKNLNIGAIGGKDSMSGTFEDLTVPPTLISFALTLEKIENVMSPEFKKVNSLIVKINSTKDNKEVIDFDNLKNNLSKITNLIKNKKILSVISLKEGGVVEGICKMAFGNKIGANIDKNIKEEDLFKEGYGEFLLEIEEKNLPELDDIDYKIIGKTIEEESIIYKDNNLSLDYLINIWENPLKNIFPIKDNHKSNIKESLYKGDKKKSIYLSAAKPKVFIPIFPGTNCEWDSAYAFEKEGAKVSQRIFKNLNENLLLESLDIFEKEIKSSQILMIPGGFSLGDEPEGSGKFITAIFKNPRIRESVMDLLKNRDGLILGICNGFQALIKLGLLPYGEIRELDKNSPTLTYNTIGRHVSSIVRTKITSTLSPWFNEVNLGDIHNVVVSHGEGRFVADNETTKILLDKGQIATQYVDLNGNIAEKMPFNPNGSVLAVEGITSPCGRVLGKMGHSERIGDNLYKNIHGSFDQKIFKAGVNYFIK